MVFPPVTGVQLQHSLESALSGSDPRRVYVPIPLSEMNYSLPWAVVAGEDSRFFRHHGIDWQAIDEAFEEYRKGERLRGGSSITQQLVKNLFMTTHRTVVRKALEVPLTYAAELLLSKQRILELYVNVIEWGPGVYGAEAASHYYYGISSATLSPNQSAALAACIPNPKDRHPDAVGSYKRVILRRMHILGPLPLPSVPDTPDPIQATGKSDGSKTSSPDEPPPPNTSVDTTASDSSSPLNTHIATDSLPPADRLASPDSGRPPDRTSMSMPDPTDTARSRSPKPPASDSLESGRTRIPEDSAGTP